MKSKIELWVQKIINFGDIRDPATRQSAFLNHFLILSLIFTIFATINDAYNLIFLHSLSEGQLLEFDAIGFVGVWAAWYFNKKGHTRLVGLVYLTMWVISITLLSQKSHPDQLLIMYAMPTTVASFILSSGWSLVFGVMSIAAYTIFYLGLDPQTAYNVYFVLTILLIAAAASILSTRLNRVLVEEQKSERKYLDLLEHSPSFTYVIHVGNPDRLIYASPMIKSLLGYSQEEWVRDPNLWKYCLHPEDKRRVLEEWTQARIKQDTFHSEYRLIRRDGRTIWVSDDAVTIRAPLEPLRVQGIMMDISARKRFEDVQAVIYKISQAANSAKDVKALFQEIHSALGTLMHVENFFIALYNAVNDTLEFPYFVDQFDLPPQPQPLGRGLTEFVLRSGQPLFADPARFDELVLQGEADEVGTPSVDWLGVPLKISNQTIGVMAVQSYTDGIRFNEEELEILTFVSTQVAMAIERKRADEALRFSENLYRTTIDSLNELIHVVDREGRFVMQNQSFRRRNERLGMPLDILGKKLPDTFTYMKNEDLENYARIFQTGEAISQVSEREINGEFFIYDADLVPIIEGERVDRVITVLRDITAQKKAEEQIKAALTEKEVLLREIHHRVKNNLQVITSLLGLQAEYIDDPHMLGLFREIQSRMRSMALVHEELYQARDLAHINYGDYIEQLTSNLLQAFAICPNIKLTLDLSEVYFGVDTAIPCGLIVNELVTNALKYAFPQNHPGTITVRLKTRHGMDGKTGYSLAVEDDGIGIPAAIDIKNPTTLGLQLVNILVSQIKGVLCLERDHGSKFLIEFNEKNGK